jgi:hypothetical protein
MKARTTDHAQPRGSKKIDEVSRRVFAAFAAFLILASILDRPSFYPPASIFDLLLSFILIHPHHIHAQSPCHPAPP